MSFFFLKPLKKYIPGFFFEATIKVYTYLCISSEATMKVYTWIFLGFRIAPPPCVFFPEATIKVYTWIFFCIYSHYKSLCLNFVKGGGPGPPPPPPLDPPLLIVMHMMLHGILVIMCTLCVHTYIHYAVRCVCVPILLQTIPYFMSSSLVQ